MGKVNKANVLHLIKEKGPISRAAVAKTLNMSRSTISAIVDHLIREGRIREGLTGASTSAGGRRPVNLHYVSTARYAFGVDIGARKTIAMIADLDGKIVYREKFSSHAEIMSSEVTSSMDHILCQLERILFESGIPRESVIGTGIGFPGVTMAEQGVVVDAPGLRLHNFPAGEFFRTLPGPVLIDNDVNMAVVGERWKGAAIGRDNVVLVAIGTGIGAGFILNGQLYRGWKGFAGEMGHMTFNPTPQSPQLLLRDYGPLEQIASGKGMEDVARNRIHEFPNSILRTAEIQAEKLFEAEAAGDALAREVVGQAIAHLSLSIANIVTILTPELVILGGGVSRIGPPLVKRIGERVNQLSPISCDIVAANLGEDAAAFGSSATVLMHAGELRLSGFDEWQTVSSTATFS